MPEVPGVLFVKARATGMTHITTDARVDVRPQIVVFTEYAHEVLALPVAAILERLAYAVPRRGTELNAL